MLIQITREFGAKKKMALANFKMNENLDHFYLLPK